jgi:hypothetical protein
MPSLADIYSAINTAKRKGSDFVQNPGTSLQQMLGNANDRARALNEQDRAATDEFLASGQLNGPKQMQSAMDLAGAYNPVGMTAEWSPAFHGTNRNFVAFDPKKSFGDLGVVWTTPKQEFAQKYASKEGKVIPLEVKEGKNFDFSNPEDLQKLREKAKKVDIYDPMRGMGTLDSKVPDVAEQGSYKSAEHPQLFSLLKKMGYDSVAVYEDGVRNLGFFKPQKNVRIKND